MVSEAFVVYIKTITTYTHERILRGKGGREGERERKGEKER